MADSAPPDLPATLELDVQKLHGLPSEQQELFLLTYTADLVRFVDTLDGDGASAHQTHFKKKIFQIINLGHPTPTRVIRQNIARSLAVIFQKGNRKLLFETINELSTLVTGGSKSEKDGYIRLAAIHCLGAVYEAAGDSAINLSTLVCVTLLKSLKAAAAHAGVRSNIFYALGRLYAGIGNGADESTAREVWRQARMAAAGDKSHISQLRACYCLEQLIGSTDFFDNSNDYDKLQQSLTKAIESSSVHVRRSAAKCWSRALVKSYTETPTTDLLVRPRRLKKAAKKAPKPDGDDEEIERPDSPAPQKPATALSFNLANIIKQLSNVYCRPATSNRARSAVAICYIMIFRDLGEGVVDQQYGNIARHFFSDILSHQSIGNIRYRNLLTRQFVKVILEETIGRDILGESAQIRAAKYLINEILKDYPQTLKERPEPSKQVLVGALSALSSLIQLLGDSFSNLAESCREVLLQVLTHPSYTVQVYAAQCLKSFVFACPQQLLPCTTICMNSLNRELGQISNAWQTPRRCVGLANGLAAILSVSTDQPLYGSVDVFSRLLSQATTLLKSSSSSDLRISSTQIQVAWILLGGLMTLGPNFVKIHISQLLLLWKNALPKPVNRENISQRNILELSFLAHVRECALGSILVFLQYNEKLLTIDVTKRLATMLQNTTVFLSSLPSKKTTEDIGLRLSPALQLHDFDLMVRRRVLQCFTKLIADAPQGSGEVLLQSNLLPFTLSCFSTPEDYAPSSISASIASSAGTFDSIWDVDDNYGFGVNTLIRGYDLAPFPGETEGEDSKYWISEEGGYYSIESNLLSSIGVAREHDSIQLYIGRAKEKDILAEPPATQVVNTSIQLFAILFPLQPSRVQESVLEQLQSFMTDSSLQRDPARKIAISVNVATSLLGALKVAVRETSLPPGNIKGDSVERLMEHLIRGFLILPDPYIRNLAAQGLGRLSKASGSHFTIKEVDELIEQIVSNREPSARAGCALALGHIYARLGGMAAGLHLKKILGVLNSLSSDPHPIVHAWALESIGRLANSAGLNFAPYVTSTLGLLAQLYVSDSHNDEVGSIPFSNSEVELPTPAILTRCVGSIINVLGPDLQETAKMRDLIMTMIDQLRGEESQLVQVECLRCQEHLTLYAPNHVEYKSYVQLLQSYLDSTTSSTRFVALDGLHNLMRRDANHVLESANPGLEDKLWLILDQSPGNEVIRSVIRNWMQQTGLRQTGIWVQRCNTILMKITVKKSNKPKIAPPPQSAGNTDFQDDEIAGFNLSSGAQADDTGTSGSSQELLKWQTRTFAMDLLSELLTMVERDAEQHVESDAETQLLGKVAEVIRMAFSASTTGVIALRIKGLRVINQILKMFSETPDPEYPEVPLLQQHQAQISSALNPAFGQDSSPELAAEAVSVCATFISAGIVTEIKQMTRILNLLSTALDSFSVESESASIGELKSLSSNAMIMVKMAIFSAWAELQVASSERHYLVDALSPKVSKLTPLWLSSLREFAKLRFEPDISMVSATAGATGDLDTMYAALNRETLLHFYQRSWLKLVEAIASLIDEKSEFVFEALDGKEVADTNGSGSKASVIPYRNEPVAFFFVLFGLAFEALMSKSTDSDTPKSQTLEILTALKKILKPSVSGNAIYQEVIFSETMDMFDRLALTESLNVQSVIVEIARNLCLEHPSARKGSGQREEENLSDDIEQLFELTRIIVLVIAGLVPNLTEDKSRVRHVLNDEAVTLLCLALSALVDASAVFPSIIETDLHACIFHIFTIILGTPSCQANVIPESLPIFKRFLSSITTKAPRPETTSQARTALARFIGILKTAQRRETEAAIPCEKNVLLASTILITTSSNIFDPTDPLLERSVEELNECLNSRIPSKVAASCAQSLLLAPKKSPTDSAISAQLFPHLITFIAQSTTVEGLEEARSIITRAIAMFPTSPAVSSTQTSTALALVIPTLLARASNDGPGSYKEIAARLLECATAGPQAFGPVVAGLEPDLRALMEEVVREGGGRKEEKKDTSDEPAIALKMDFL